MPTPPVDLAMPGTAQAVMLVITAVAAVGAIGLAVRQCRRRHDLVPIYLMLGAALAIFYEPVGDILGMAYYPEAGQVGWIDTFGRSTPMFIALLYFVYFPPFIMWFLGQVDKGMTVATWWKVWGATVISTFVFEPIPLHFGLWTYYGPQPLRLFGFPLYWAFLNATFIYVLAMGVYAIVRHFPSRHHWLIVPAMPLLLLAGHGAPALPVATTLASTDSRLINELGGLLTMGLCVLVSWMGARVFTSDRAAQAAPSPQGYSFDVTGSNA